ncbi:MAG: hypothetical protein WC503_02820 [Candidatus Shapirobacteria bacterium]
MFYNGILTYYSWRRPWLIDDHDVSADLKNKFKEMDGKFVVRVDELASHSIKITEEKEGDYFELEYKDDDHYPFLNNPVGYDWSNEGAYLERYLEWVNGRRVSLEIDEEGFEFKALDNPDLELKFYRDNMCKVTNEQAKNVCKIGQEKDTCIFVSVSGKGFECMKFSGACRIMLERLAENKLNSGRIGNCLVNGREENENV